MANAFGDASYIAIGLGTDAIVNFAATGTLNSNLMFNTGVALGGVAAIANNVPLYLWGDKEMRVQGTAAFDDPQDDPLRLLKTMNFVKYPLEFTGWIVLAQCAMTVHGAVNDLVTKGYNTPLLLTAVFGVAAGAGGVVMVAFRDSKPKHPYIANDNSELPVPTARKPFKTAASEGLKLIGNVIREDIKDIFRGVVDLARVAGEINVAKNYVGFGKAVQTVKERIEQAPPTAIAARFFNGSLYCWGGAMAVQGNYYPMVCLGFYRLSNVFIGMISKRTGVSNDNQSSEVAPQSTSDFTPRPPA